MTPKCIHSDTGLCPDCRAEFDEDPDAWWEFGAHPQGIENTKRLETDMEVMHCETESDCETRRDDDLPF